MQEIYWKSRYPSDSYQEDRVNHHYITSMGGRIQRDSIYV